MKGETTRLEELMGALYERVAEIFAGHGELVPAWMLEDAAGQRTVLLTPVDGPTKNLLAAAVRKLLVEHKAVRYAFATEIWLDAEHKEDAVMISGEERDSPEKRLVFHRIDRTRAKPRLKPPETAQAIGGQFFGMFDREGA